MIILSVTAVCAILIVVIFVVILFIKSRRGPNVHADKASAPLLRANPSYRNDLLFGQTDRFMDLGGGGFLRAAESSQAGAETQTDNNRRIITQQTGTTSLAMAVGQQYYT